MALVRSPYFAFPLAVLLLTAVSGCSHPLEVDLPPNYHGQVSILCDEMERVATPIQVDGAGIAQHAKCPRSQTALVVVRGGQPVSVKGTPHWSTTGDGILLSIEFDVP